MISKNEILQAAKALRLEPTTVEKDYVLSWVLFGISKHPKLSEWFFKGGTCLKKCYFETYRFSEDLDFTVPSDAIYNKNDITNALNEVADIVLEYTGINLKIKPVEIKESQNKNNSLTFEAKYSYLGPLNIRTSTPPRIKFDITNDEIIVDSSDLRDVFHAYTDEPSTPIKMRCYSINEILAEKSRALYERQGRSRDIYDIVNISRNFRSHVDIKKARRFLFAKFQFKNLPTPTVDLILSQISLDMLKSGWDGQLRHQLQTLPPVESFFSELREALSWWVDEDSQEKDLHPISEDSDEISLPIRDFPEAHIANRNLGLGSATRSVSYPHIDQIRYAARNRLCLKIEYDGVVRLVEPYSIRVPKTKNVLLYAYSLMKGNEVQNHIRSYNIYKIAKVEVTEQPFIPRYVVEL
jgi:predicted nucleotidyltransferase component of viral defense system